MEGFDTTTPELHSEPQTTNTKHNFKTFSLLRQQDDRLTQFEDNLKKTLDLLTKHQTDNGNTSNRKSELLPGVNTLETQTELNAGPTTHKLEEAQSNSPMSLCERLTPNEARNIVSQVELHVEELSRISHTSNNYKVSSLESELRSLKLQSSDLENENQILKSSLNSLSLVRTSIGAFESRRSLNSGEQKEIQELRLRFGDAQSENEHLRQELLKIKSESFCKFETLQKNNDELLASYEQRFKLSLKNITERYENEIKDLQKEVAELKANQKRFEEDSKSAKERVSETITDLERDKQQLLTQMNKTLVLNESQLFSLQSPTNKMGGLLHLADMSSNPIVEQLTKDKSDVQSKYHDLFTAYNSLLLHNKAISERLQRNESRTALPPVPHKGNESFRIKGFQRDSSSQLRALVKDQKRQSTSPTQRNLTDAADTEGHSVGTSHKKNSKIRASHELKLNQSVGLSNDESQTNDTVESSSISNCRYTPIPQQTKSSRKSLEENKRRSIASKSHKRKSSLNQSIQKLDRDEMTIINSSAVLNTEDPKEVSPEFRPLRASQKLSAAKLNTSAKNKKEASIEIKKKARPQNPRERSFSAKKADKENRAAENTETLASSVNSSSKISRKNTARAPTAKKIICNPKIKKLQSQL